MATRALQGRSPGARECNWHLRERAPDPSTRARVPVREQWRLKRSRGTAKDFCHQPFVAQGSQLRDRTRPTDLALVPSALLAHSEVVD